MTTDQATTVLGACTECRADVSLNAPRVSEITECSGCKAELEVMSTQPLVLALAPEVEEDWGE